MESYLSLRLLFFVSQKFKEATLHVNLIGWMALLPMDWRATIQIKLTTLGASSTTDPH